MQATKSRSTYEGKAYVGLALRHARVDVLRKSGITSRTIDSQNGNVYTLFGSGKPVYPDRPSGISERIHDGDRLVLTSAGVIIKLGKRDTAVQRE